MSGQTSPSRGRLSYRASFWAVGSALGIVLLASTAPSPLYAIYQQQWQFSATSLTVVFAVYAAALLASLLVFGRLSDHLGRRPVLTAALLVTIAAMIVFLTATGVEGLLVARLLQGVGSGGVTAAGSSALLELERRGSGHGGLASTLVPGAAMAVGSPGAAALVCFAPFPTHLVWIVLIVLLCGAVIGVALSAFYLALGPKLTALLAGDGNVVFDTVIVALLTGAGSIASESDTTAPLAVSSAPYP